MRRYGAIAMVGGAVLAVALLGGIGERGVASAQPEREGACYQDQRILGDAGDFTAASSGQGQGEAEIENGAFHPPATTARVRWTFWERVRGNSPGNPNGSMAGYLELWLTFANGTQVHFVSRCLQEAQISTQPTAEIAPLLAEQEAEFEGTINRFPTSAGRGRPAVASLHVSPSGGEPGQLTYEIGLEAGITGTEGPDEINATGSADGQYDTEAPRNAAANPGRCASPPNVVFGCPTAQQQQEAP